MKRQLLLSLVLLFVDTASLLAQDGRPGTIVNWPAPLLWQPPGEPRARARSESVEGARPKEALVDVSDPLPFVAIAPCRMLDTRLQGGSIPSGSPRTVVLTGPPCGIPSGVTAVSANFAVFNIVGSAGNGVLTVWPDGFPGSSQALVNWSTASGQIDNASIVVVGASGAVTAQPNQGGGSIDLVVDVNGYYAGNVVTGVTAGTGLTGGGTSGNVTVGIADGGVGTPQLADSSVTPAKLASNAVTLAGEVTGPQMATVVSAASPSSTANTIVRRNSIGGIEAGTAGLSGDLILYAPSSATAGRVIQGSATLLHTTGNGNVFLGQGAGTFSTVGPGFNTAIGTSALSSIAGGAINTAIGNAALGSNANGTANVAVGHYALQASINANYNTAVGIFALSSNTSGLNTAMGSYALNNNTTGISNTAIGYQAMVNSIDGQGNTAVGVGALGTFHGSANVAIGFGAGGRAGDSNIDIGYLAAGPDGEIRTTRIGNNIYQRRAFIAGIRGVPTDAADGLPVLIDSNGQLGTTSSSASAKRDIADVAEASSALLKLHPVRFVYRTDATSTRQYGLIAEEVAKIMPELVQFSPAGDPETVRYHFLAPLLLNEVQRQDRTIQNQARLIEEQRLELRILTERVRVLEQRASDLGER